MSDELHNQSLVNSATVNTAIAEVGLANERAFAAEQRARRAERDAASKTTDNDLRRNMLDARRDQEIAQKMYESLRIQLEKKEALLLDWMHTNEAFKRLARQYGARLGVTDEQRTKDFDETMVMVSEEDPKFANTDPGARVKIRMSLNK